MSLHRATGALALLALTPWVAAAQAPLTLEHALELALTSNPDLKEEAAGLDSLSSALEEASAPSRFNPEVSAAIGPRFMPNGTALEYEFEVAQTLEVFGAREARRMAARARVTQGEADYASLRARVAFDVRVAFAAALAAERELALAQKAQSLAEEALAAARVRREAGAAPRMEVNTARAEQGRAAREGLLARARLSAAKAKLRGLLALEPSHPIELVGTLPDRAEEIPPLESLEKQALEKRADHAAALATLVAAEHEATLAERLKKPNPTFGVSFGKDEDAHLAMGTFSIPVPLFDRNQAGRGTARGELKQARLRVEHSKARIRREIAVAADRLRAANEALALYRGGVLEALEENLELSLEAYRAGKLDFLGLLLVRRQVHEGRADFIHVQQELNDARAELDRAQGATP